MLRSLVVFGALVVFTGCSGAPSSQDGGADGGTYIPVEKRQLGLNDVTMLLPLQSIDAGYAPMPSPIAMVPFDLFDRLSTDPGDVITDINRLRIVALRFDICDRSKPEPCAPGANGIMRVVLQPLQRDGTADDVAFHAFYPVPAAEVPELVDTLRALARLQDVPVGSALKVNTAWRTNPEYTEKLSALVARYASTTKIVRLTLFGQLTMNAALVWVFRGVEKRGAGFERITIPAIKQEDQQTLLFSGSSFTAMPIADAPTGFVRVMSETDFRTSTPAQQLEALESLAASDNPKLNTADTVQCVTCHVATTIIGDRAQTAGVQLSSLQSAYKAPQFDLTPLGDASTRFLTLRALGWLRNKPLVAMRAVHESANVVEEMEARFPPAP